MILTKSEILRRLGTDIVIDPVPPDKCFNPNSVNLHLGSQILTYNELYLDPKRDNKFSISNIPEKGMTLYPGVLYLAQTYEFTRTNNLVPVISGRSSTGRLGLHVHVTAGFGDTGFTGHWTLELAVVQPLMIYPKMPLCQIYYHTILGEPEQYKGKYQGNMGVQPSMMWRDFQ
jgi:dCTP deaminase